MILLKKCKVCNIEKSVSEFYRHPWIKDRLYSHCKDCHRDKLWINKVKEKECKFCWKLFMQKYAFQKYCSFHCMNSFTKNNKKKEYYDKNYENICKTCWNKFITHTKKTIFCSTKCIWVYEWNQRKWENNPAYRNWRYCYKSFTKDELSEKRYENNWFQYKELYINRNKIKDQQIKQKWYSFCEHCKTTSSLRWETHHIVYRSEKPKHKNLHNINNLIRLCISCHNEFHKNKKMRNNYVIDRWLNELFLWDFTR